MEDLVFANDSSSPHPLSWAKFPKEVADDIVVRLLFVSFNIEVDDELATRVVELGDRTAAKGAVEGGAGLGRK